MAAPACHFNDGPCGREALSCGDGLEPFRHGVRSGLIDAAAGIADHEHHRLAGAVRRGAGDERVEALQTMDKALRAQKIERAIDGDRCWRLLATRSNPFNQIISADGPMGGIERLEHGAAKRSQPFATLGAAFLSGSEGGGRAGGLIMRMGAIMMGVVVNHVRFYHGGRRA